MAYRTGTLITQPFPRMTWSWPCWEFQQVLPSWSGITHRPARGKTRRFDGKFRFCVYALGPLPTGAQVNAYEYLMKYEAAVSDAMIKALFKQYRHDQKFDDYKNLPGDMPRLRNSSDLREIVAPNTVHIFHEADKDTSLVGFTFYCDAWDSEHGHGVVMHKRKAVSVGSIASVVEHREYADYID